MDGFCDFLGNAGFDNLIALEESGRGQPHSKTLARNRTLLLETREIELRRSKSESQRGKAKLEFPNERFRQFDRSEESGRGQPHSRTLARNRTLLLETPRTANGPMEPRVTSWSGAVLRHFLWPRSHRSSHHTQNLFPL